MTRAQKVGCWLGAVVSLVAAGYFGTSVVFYAWLSAAEPDRWPSDRAAIWVYSSLAAAIVSAIVFATCIVLLVKDVNRGRKG